MKNIYLEITPFFPTETSFRGPYIFDQVKAIQKLSEYEVIVIKIVGAYNKVKTENYNYQGIKVYVFTVFDLPSSILPGLFHQINAYRFKIFLFNHIGLDVANIAVAHSHSIYPAGALGNSLKCEYGTKHFIQFHGLDVLQENVGKFLKGWFKEVNNRYKYKRYLKIINNTDLNIGVSQAVVNQLKRIKYNINNRSYVLYNGVDIKKFYDTKYKNTGIYTVGCISNFGEKKDQKTLLKAVNILVKERGVTAIKILFIGTGDTLLECKEYVFDNHLESYVIFKDEVDHTKLNTFYNNIDLFVLPSYYEALGCVYMEAMQIGKPIVAIERQGIEELIKPEDKKYFLMEKKNSKQLVELISYHYNHRNKIYKYNFQIDDYIKKFISTIEVR